MKTRRENSFGLLLGILIFSCPLSGGFSQTPPPNLENLPPGMREYFEPEAPASLLDLSLGDLAAELFIYGTWTSQLGAHFGVSFVPDSQGDVVAIPGTFPGLEAIPFKNTVDLLVSIWIDRGYFLEADAKKEFSDLGLLMGYSNWEQDFWLSRVWLGNRGIGVLGNPMLPQLAVIDGTPGITAAARSSLGVHEVVLRLDGRQTSTRYFLGTQEVEMVQIENSRWVSGFSFILPWGFPASLQDEFDLYQEVAPSTPGAIEDEAGIRYLPLKAREDYQLLAEQGRVYLKEHPGQKRIVAMVPPFEDSYQENPLVPLTLDPNAPNRYHFQPTDTLEVRLPPGQDLELYADRLDTLELSEDSDPATWPGITRLFPEFPRGSGSYGILLFDPQRFSPFMDYGFYSLKSNQDGETPETPESTEPSESPAGQELLRADYQPGGGSGILPMVLQQLSPTLLRIIPGDTGGPRRLPLLSYTPEALNTNPYISRSLQPPGTIRFYRPLGEDSGVITLSPDTKPGSITVLRNGVPVQDVEIIPETGELRLRPEPHNTELITVTQQSHSPGSAFTNLSIGTQHRISLAEDRFTLGLGVAGSIPIAEDGAAALTDLDAEGLSRRSGLLEGRLDTSYLDDWITARISLEAQLQTSDRFGGIGIFSSGGTTFTVISEPYRALPLSDLAPSWLYPETSLPELSRETRALPVYRDSYIGGSIRELPRTYDDPALTEDSTLPPGEQDGVTLTGPYPVRGTGTQDSLIEGYGHLLESHFTENQVWTGMILPGALWSETPEPDAPDQDRMTSPPSRIRGTVGLLELPQTGAEVDLYLLVGHMPEDLNSNGTIDQGYPLALDAQGTILAGTDWQRGYTAGLIDIPPGEDLNRNAVLDRFQRAQGMALSLGSFTASGPGTITFDRPIPPSVRIQILQGTAEIALVAINKGQSPGTLRIVAGDWRYIFDDWPLSPDTGGTVIQYPPDHPLAQDLPGLPTRGDWGQSFAQGNRQFSWNTGQPESWETGTSFSPVPKQAYNKISLSFYIHDLDQGTMTLLVRGQHQGTAVSLPAALSLPSTPGWYRLDIDLTQGDFTLSDAQNTVLQSGSLTTPIPEVLTGLGIEMSETNRGTVTLGQAWFSSPNTRGQLSTQGDLILRAGESSIYGLTQVNWITGNLLADLGLTLGYSGFSLRGNLTLGNQSYTTSPEIISAGHGLTLPLGLLSLGHSYTQGLDSTNLWNSLTNTLQITLGKTAPQFTLSLASSLSEASGLLHRSWKGSMGFSGKSQGDSHASAPQFNATLTHTQGHRPSTPRTLSTNYPSSLLASLEHSAPWIISQEDSRSYTGTTGLKLPGMELSYSIADEHPPGSIGPRAVRAGQKLTLFLIQTESADLTLNYSRDSVSQWEPALFHSIGEDLQSLGRIIQQAPRSIIDLPLADLLWPESILEIPGSSAFTLTPSITLNLSRPLRGLASDLYTPSSVFVGAGRISTEARDSTSLGGSVGINALNIFGRRGILASSQAFDSDDIRLSGGFVLVHPEMYWYGGLAAQWELYGLGSGAGSPPPQSLWDLPISPLGFPQGGSLLPHTLTLNTDLTLVRHVEGGFIGSLGGGYSYDTPMPPMPEQLKAWTDQQPWQLIHQTTGMIAGQLPGSGLSMPQEQTAGESPQNSPSMTPRTWNKPSLFTVPLVSSGSFSIIIKHSSVIVLPGAGSLRLFAGLGWRLYEYLKIPDTLTHQLGGHVGIEVQLQL